MTRNETHESVDLEFTPDEMQLVGAAAIEEGQSFSGFVEFTARTRASAAAKPAPRIVFVPANSVPSFPFFGEVGARL